MSSDVYAVSNISFEHFCDYYRRQVEDQLAQLETPLTFSDLQEAMCYSTLHGGKRVRALLVYASALCVGKVVSLTHQAAAAVECIHAYSLIHDDLPAMDDDDMRRGKPSCHIQFSEASAILAGDALQARAFEYLSGTTIHAERQLRMVHILAQASGAAGMVGGQAVDLASVNHTLSLQQLQRMHTLKTAALIKASVQLGALSSANVDQKMLDSLAVYADAIGLAFQIQDDILDVTANTMILGKQQGADAAQNKPTFVSLLGLEPAKNEAAALKEKAVTALQVFEGRAVHLEQLADYIIDRDY